MAIDTYAALQASIAGWIHRTDLTALLPDFITLTEKRITTLLKARASESVTTISTVAGVATAALPASLLGIDSLSIDNVAPAIEYLPPGAYFAHYPDVSYSGAPRHYTIVGEQIFFGPVPDAAYTIKCAMRASVVPLSDAAPTNALLAKWPNVYLYGALVEATDWTKDLEANAKYEGRFQEAIDGINKTDWHAGGPMRVRTDVRMC